MVPGVRAWGHGHTPSTRAGVTEKVAVAFMRTTWTTRRLEVDRGRAPSQGRASEETVK